MMIGKNGTIQPRVIGWNKVLLFRDIVKSDISQLRIST